MSQFFDAILALSAAGASICGRQIVVELPHPHMAAALMAEVKERLKVPVDPLAFKPPHFVPMDHGWMNVANVIVHWPLVPSDTARQRTERAIRMIDQAVLQAREIMEDTARRDAERLEAARSLR